MSSTDLATLTVGSQINQHRKKVSYITKPSFCVFIVEVIYCSTVYSTRVIN